MSTIKHALKQHFIPHEGNNYHPHMLHTKRAVFYGAFFIALKACLVIVAVSLPIRAYLAPDVLAGQTNKLVSLTNNLRKEKGLPLLVSVSALTASSQEKASDMAQNGYFSHAGPNGHTLSYFLKRSGYRYSTAGENLAMGFSDAASVMNAWIKSPTHYANLVDPDFTEFGMGIDEGMFEGTDTVFVAQHFGRPLAIAEPEVEIASTRSQKVTTRPVAKQPAPAPAKAPEKTAQQVVPVKPVVIPSTVASSSVAVSSTLVMAQTESNPEALRATSTSAVSTSTIIVQNGNPLVYNHDLSYVGWTDTTAGSTQLNVRVAAVGDLKNVSASVEGYPVELAFSNNDQAYTGTLTIPEKSSELFRTVVSPTVRFTLRDGSTVHETIDWKDPKVVSPTPWQTYMQAKGWFSVIPSVFSISHWVYAGFLILFSIALALSIFIQIRKQHPHIILQTIGLIGLLAVMLKF